MRAARKTFSGMSLVPDHQFPVGMYTATLRHKCSCMYDHFKKNDMEHVHFTVHGINTFKLFNPLYTN